MGRTGYSVLRGPNQVAGESAGRPWPERRLANLPVRQHRHRAPGQKLPRHRHAHGDHNEGAQRLCQLPQAALLHGEQTQRLA